MSRWGARLSPLQDQAAPPAPQLPPQSSLSSSSSSSADPRFRPNDPRVAAAAATTTTAATPPSFSSSPIVTEKPVNPSVLECRRQPTTIVTTAATTTPPNNTTTSDTTTTTTTPPPSSGAASSPQPPPNNNNNDSPSSSSHYDDNDDGFVEITEVEWANEENNLSGELATRPRYDTNSDPCGCEPDGTTPCCIDMSCVLFACQEECRPRNCLGGDLCGNQRISRKQWKSLQVFDAGPKKGRGLRTLEFINQDDFIAEYVGRAIRKQYLDALFRRYRHERKLYIMALDNNVYIDARQKGGIARYINHSCEPNCIVERWKVKGILRAGIFALRDIQVGEELSFDYKWDRKRGRAPTKCHCLTPTCRGTLEMPKSLEEEELDRKLMGHWKKHVVVAAAPGSNNNGRPGREIVNRSIKILSEEHHEYFWADVCKYDETTGQHLVIYRHDLEESWEDLSKEDWMILDEEAEQFVIAKKTKATSLSSLVNVAQIMGDNNNNSSDGQQQQQQLQALKNYIFVQTPVKDELVTRHLINRCQQNCRVTITITQCFPQTNSEVMDVDHEEMIEQNQALQASKDGCVWKLSISGFNLAKAYTILEKSVAFFAKKLQEQELAATAQSTCEAQEVILPRCIVDLVKMRLAYIRDKCRNVNVTFAPSESKSKQFAKLTVEASLVSDLTTAQDFLWKQLVAICSEAHAPLAQPEIPKDLGMLGGELSSEQFRLLYENHKDRLSQAYSENMRESAFFASFESTQRCAVWVQAEDDMGRIDEQNRVVHEASPDAPRKIFFGCDPKDIPKLWGLVQTRATELARGVKYLHLGADKMYQQVMMQTGSRFFDYVKGVTGATVSVDSVTGNHLRIDGGTQENGQHSAALAEELIRLQIELYRDHCIRQQSWVFGRDWTLIDGTCSPVVVDTPTSPGPRSSTPSSRNQFDSRSVSTACTEIAEITSCLELDGSVAAHAAIIMYRFLNRISDNKHPGTQSKLREILLASIFLASKSQKVSKWKRLEVLLEAAYPTFYPGSKFDKDGEEAAIWEKRVLSAETEILVTTDYDIFWSGAEWMLKAAIEGGQVAEPLAQNALDFAFSGAVLGAGPTLWLKYGPEYVFAAAAGFLSVNLEHLFSALSLIPLKVSQAAELIANSIKTSSVSKKSSSSELLNGGKETLLNYVPHIREVCIKTMSQQLVADQSSRIGGSSEAAKRFHIIGHRDKGRRVFRGVSASLVRDHILPIIDGVSAESQCSISIGGSTSDAADVVLEGNWRAMAIAEYVLEAGVTASTAVSTENNNMASESPSQTLPKPADMASDKDALGRLQAKGEPGFLRMSAISTADGWDGTTLSIEMSPGMRKTGGKCCVAGKITELALQKVGLRWWIPPRYGPSLTGSLCDMFSTRTRTSTDGSLQLEALAKLTKALLGEALSSSSFPLLTSGSQSEMKEDMTKQRFIAVSMQRWPSEKVAAREETKSSKAGMPIGVSPAALQEMQLLTQLHGLIPAPKGHPNFILPVAVALPPEPEERDKSPDKTDGQSTAFGKNGRDDDIFSLFRTSEENERVAKKEKKRKDSVTGPHLVFQPTPFVMQRLMSRSKKRRDQDGEGQTMSPALLAAWFHDLLSALVHCHTNNVILRTLQSDQIVIDHSGVAKLAGLYRATVLSPEEREKPVDPLRSARSRKEKSEESSEDVSNTPYLAPEILLGSKKHTKETDVWAVGCLMANLLLKKPFFLGKDRSSLLLSIFKIVGTPSSDNYSEASKFPYFEEPAKRYKRGVDKALRYIMKEDEAEKHSGALDLLSRMLHLDPKKRITAVEALSHDYMTEYIENSGSDSFRQQYVKDWMSLRGKLIRSGKAEEDEARKQEKTLKRKANFLMAASAMDNDEDDLYDMDDLLGGTDKSEKKPRVSLY